MKVEIVSIGTQLLMSDVLDTNTPYISRALREANVPLTCKVAVGDDKQMIADVLEVALRRADIVLAIASSDDCIEPHTREAVADVTGRDLSGDEAVIAGASLMGGSNGHKAGLLIEQESKAIICLPGNRREMAYLLDNEVLPYIRDRMSVDQGWRRMLLRTVDIMESSLKQQLADLSVTSDHRITYDSYAGQTNIQLWAEVNSKTESHDELEALKQEIISRLGDHIFGEGDARLEDVVMRALRKSKKRVAIAECATNHILVRTLSRAKDFAELIQSDASASCNELIAALDLESLSSETDLTDWCQTAAERLLDKTGTDLGLFVCKNTTQGGVQIAVGLASPHGVSVTQRTFGGHPENIDQWAQTLGLAHLRRWLLVHQ